MPYKHWNICNIFHHVTVYYSDIAINTLHSQLLQRFDKKIVTRIYKIVNNTSKATFDYNIKSGFVIPFYWCTNQLTD